jgi:hypothetical protein
MKKSVILVVAGCLLVLIIAFGIFNIKSVENVGEGGVGGEIGFDEAPDSFNLNVGEEFYYDFDAGEDYIFSDDADFFDIDPETGEVSFVPLTEGEFDIVIIAMKNAEDFYYKSIRFVVVEW